jgi:hypothetical protein
MLTISMIMLDGRFSPSHYWREEEEREIWVG